MKFTVKNPGESLVPAKQTLPSIGILANATVEEGDDVYLDCPVINKTAVSKVQWFRILPSYLHISNDGNLQTTKTEKYGVKATDAASANTQAINTVTLIIKHVADSDVGRYRCRVLIPQVSYPLWPSKDSFVSIAAPPVILSVGNTKVVSAVGGDVTLTCRVYGAPEPTITWYKGDAGTNIMGHGEVLHLEGLRAGDGGEYSCEADNGVSPNAMETYHITIKQEPLCSAPRLHVMQAKNIFQPAEMSCHITGYPVPKVTWKRYTVHGIQTIFTSKYDIHNILPKDNSGVMTSVLKVYNVTGSDFGTYICEGLNDIDQCTAEIRLLESRECVGPHCDSRTIISDMEIGHSPAVTTPAPSDDDDDATQEGQKAPNKQNSGVTVIPPMSFICVLSLFAFFITV
ncbi:lachesin-like [Ylistrum balloti]|uniref:lachesin-like n=1 Tax=Ylistrum balloti TaxID=509963 RepID=UPI0029059FFD|nr:lachesin-like [Ylistrum balloti]